MDEEQKKTLAALYAHWDRRAEAVGPERAVSWHSMMYGMRETLGTLGYSIEPNTEFPHYRVEEKQQ